jgi:hypothetical protein
MDPQLGIQLGSLIVTAVGLWFLVRYVRYTKKIAEQAVFQTEATSKPAVIAVHRGTINDLPRLRNLGTGPALDVEWAVSGTKKAGRISYIEGSEESDGLNVGLNTLEHGAVESGTNKVAIRCSYKSISGMKYNSVSDYDFMSGRFSTTFEDASSH